MLKKIGVILLLSTIFLIGCESDSSTSANISARRANLEEVEISSFFYTMSQPEENVLLFDVIENEMRSEFVFLEEDMQFWGHIQIDDSYQGIFGVTGLETSGSRIFPFPENSNITMTLYILDERFNVIDEIKITDELFIHTFNSPAILHDNGNWLIYYTTGWDFDLMTPSRNIYVYDTKSNQRLPFFELDEGLTPSGVEVINNNQLGFNAGTGQENSTVSYYGIICLDTKDLQLFGITDSFGFFGGNLVHEYYVLFSGVLTDHFDGSIIILDIRIGDYRKITLDDYEALAAKIIGDGQLILTRHNEWDSDYFRFRVYNLQTLDILLEEYVSFNDLGLQADEEVFILDQVTVDDGLYGLIFGIQTASERDFSIDNLRFHIEFIITGEY